jgi:hypothetical protein
MSANGCTCCSAQRSRLVAKSVRGNLDGRPVEIDFAAVRVPAGVTGPFGDRGPILRPRLAECLCMSTVW